MMHLAMRVSVITPSFNQARFLPETLASVGEQDHDDIEHIVIDGGSTDGSVEVIQAHAHQLAFWVSESDDGQTDALCRGFDRATGDIYCWLNSDDLFEPWTLREVVDFFESHPHVDFVYGDATWISDDGDVLKQKREHSFARFVFLHDHNFIPQPSAFWRRSLYERVGGLDRSYNLAMDADLWARFAEVTKPVHVARPWSRMRFYPEQKNTALRPASLEEMERIRSRYTSSGLVPDSTLRAAARFLRVVLKVQAGGYSVAELRRGLSGRARSRSWEDSTLNRPSGTEGPSSKDDHRNDR
jgi:glycosyltransferase involved in cell wall biosynthesis